jgi:putrescine transport system substrate-binding protein
MKLRFLAVTLAACTLAACGGKKEESATGAAAPASAAAAADASGDKVVNVYNWSDYIAEDTNANFEKATGIKVAYDVYDSNEVLETKLLAGSSGYDVVVPSANFLGRQVQAGVFQPLDKRKIPNLAGLDPALMKRLEKEDPGNQYAVPYMWGTDGIGYNVDKIKKIFGNTDIARSLDIVFKPENARKLKDCGITLLDSPDDIIPIALNYLHEDPNSLDPAVINKVVPLLKAVRPYIANFHSSEYIDALANGDTCLVIGYSGDVIQARDRADEAGNGVHIDYSIPKEGTNVWFDLLAIPKDARHVDAAYAYINYLLDPKVEAANTNYISYPNPVPASKQFIDKDIVDDPVIYPPEADQKNLFDAIVLPPQTSELYNRIWTDLKTGH